MLIAVVFACVFAALAVMAWRSLDLRPLAALPIEPFLGNLAELEESSKQRERRPPRTRSRYVGLGRPMEAMVICKFGLQHDEPSVHGRLLLAQIYAAQGKKRRAIAEARNAVAIDPSNTAAQEAVRSLIGD